MRCLIPILALALAPAALANNTDASVPIRVTLVDGTVYDGTPKFTRTKLELKGTRKKKVRYGEIASISDVPPPTEEELAKLRRKFEARAGRTPDEANNWARLGDWARDNGLDAEAQRAFETAIELDPECLRAQHALGWTEEDGAWMRTREVVDIRRAALAADDLSGWVELAKLAYRGNDHASAMDLLQGVLRQDNYHTEALEALHPLTNAYRHTVRPLRLPVAGRWRASEDKSRHHGLKHFAVYALDLVVVDDEGRHHKGKGKKLEDHFAYGAPFYAVADGTVVEVRDGHPDNPIGEIGDQAEQHNGVSIDHGNGEFSWYIHAKNGSVAVELGQKVVSGQFLGEVGNSGGSAVPHMHFTMIAFDRTSVPWACDGYTLIAPDGTPLRVTSAAPREGWTIVAPEGLPRTAPPESGGTSDDDRAE